MSQIVANVPKLPRAGRSNSDFSVCSHAQREQFADVPASDEWARLNRASNQSAHDLPPLQAKAKGSDVHVTIDV